ncbi:serine palmitoyltransferase-like protein [Strigomonas culicis]|uniref:serine C-palmitoyltransferase n=1 Tax=Strigomonas culicis TaxID=28005 RepID=S9U329_9TRYP|nr:serine palmitoyltransferase-like protein [Strigomonas culicis]EPY36303.1 serine palmitoyltransferase-like protein [Strigomonas culicis]|eukprot:EPY23179.1 serine palmitoyltransferase-like protein [Strigomonas culicis]
MDLFPVLVAFFFGVLAVFLFQQKKRSGKKAKAPTVNMPSVEEQERRLHEYQSVMFRDATEASSNVAVPSFKGLLEVESRKGSLAVVKGGAFAQPTECLDLGTFDYHSFSTHPAITEVARQTVLAYGVGSCGPRGFYGTVKPHLDAEKDLTEFLGTEATVIYSFSYATVATLVSCFASRGDYLVADAYSCSPVVEGCLLSRAHYSTYKHNDMADLERQLKAIAAKDNALKPKRRFVVAEGLFKNFGDFADLKSIIPLCRKYKFRLILEDSYGFGAVGKTGRGTPELFGFPTSEVDVYIGSMSAALGAVGGFCSGALNMVDFQRMGSTAYVFSASLPPYVTASVSKALAIMTEDVHYVKSLNENTKRARAILRDAKFDDEKIALQECAEDASPIIMLVASEGYVRQKGRMAVEDQLQRVINAVAAHKVIVIKHLYVEEEPTFNLPSLRIVIKGDIEEVKLVAAIDTVVAAVKKELA